MIKLENKPNVDEPTGDYPFGKIRDDSGTNDGTPVNTEVYGDMHQFFEKFMEISGLAPNGVPDNNANGYQLVESVFKALGTGTALRTAVIDIGGWDMETSGSILVALPSGINLTMIRSIDVIIKNDLNTELYSVGMHLADPGNEKDVFLALVNSLGVNLTRRTGGFFDSLSFNNDTINRGYITIVFETALFL